MYKLATGVATIAALVLLGGCQNSTVKNTSSSKSNSSSVTFTGTKKERAAKMDVDSLFKDSKHSTLLSGTKPTDVDTVKTEVLALKVGSVRKKLLADVKVAETLAKNAYQQSLSSSAKSESIYKKNAPKRESESIAQAKKDSESESKAESRSESFSAWQKSYDESSKKEASSEETANSQNDANRYEKKLMKLGVDKAHATDVSYSNNTVTWTGYDDWKTWSHSELQGMLDILQTITHRNAPAYNQETPNIVYQLSDGTKIAHKDSSHSQVWDN